ISTSYPRPHSSVIKGNTFFCASGSPPVTSTRPQPNSSSFAKTSAKETFSPPENVYSLSHQTQRIGQPVRRTNEHGLPACELSPCIDKKISVKRNSINFASSLNQHGRIVKIRRHHGRGHFANRIHL